MKQSKTNNIVHLTNEPLPQYLAKISSIPLASIEEEMKLISIIKSGGANFDLALAYLVTVNLRFVVSVAKQYKHTGQPLASLINKGNAGLIEAAKRYDPSRGFKFISYAVWWIRRSICQTLLTNGGQLTKPLVINEQELNSIHRRLALDSKEHNEKTLQPKSTLTKEYIRQVRQKAIEKLRKR